MSRTSGKGQRSWVKHGVSGGLCGFYAVQCADESQSSGEYFTTDVHFIYNTNVNMSTLRPVCTYLSNLSIVKKSVLH